MYQTITLNLFSQVVHENTCILLLHCWLRPLTNINLGQNLSFIYISLPIIRLSTFSFVLHLLAFLLCFTHTHFFL